MNPLSLFFSSYLDRCVEFIQLTLCNSIKEMCCSISCRTNNLNMIVRL